MNFRRPDVVIGTKDWESVEGFLRNVEPDRMAGRRGTHKYHVRKVLQSGERWYLNLLVSETTRQSRIISTAATKLGRGSVHDKRIEVDEFAFVKNKRLLLNKSPQIHLLLNI